MAKEPTRVADWEEGQCGRSECGNLWFKTKYGAVCAQVGVHFNGFEQGSLCDWGFVAVPDESARQVFIDYFTRKGK